MGTKGSNLGTCYTPGEAERTKYQKNSNICVAPSLEISLNSRTGRLNEHEQLALRAIVLIGENNIY